CNAQAGSGVAYGTETFVVGLHKSKENLSVAMRENSVITMEDNYLETYDGLDPNQPSTYIVFSLYSDSFRSESIQFAQLVEDQFSKRAGRKSRGVKQGALVVLYKSAMPAVLIESGFLSNKTEESYLLSDEGQSIMASAIYRAFKEYKYQQENKSENQVAPIRELEPSAPEIKKEQAKINEEISDPVIVLKNGKTKKSKSKKKKPKDSYRIQLYSKTEAIDAASINWGAVGTVEIDFKPNGEQVYLLQEEFTEKSKAMSALERLKKLGFKGAELIINNS
ncbi:N-acetylmuramoyl-L-alanine amidase, partial [Chitinophagales bacterium]|nr:N-acetylmuramoyl-L-alanine amidase [Chitinophagales bacterium]